MTYKYWVFVCLGLLFPLPRAVALNPQTAIAQYAHTAWRLQDGLLSAPPTAIAQTRDGYIWIGTRSGLLRFDGVTFSPWQAPAAQSPLQGLVVSLLGASDGSLWIGTSDGIARWDGRQLTFYSAPRARVDAIGEGPHGEIWFSRARQADKVGSLCQVAASKVKCIGASQGNPLSYATAMAVDSTGDVWAGGPITSIFRYTNKGTASYPIPAASFQNANLPSGVSAMSADPQGGGIWVGTPYAGPGLGLEYLRDGRFSSPQFDGLDTSRLKVETVFADPSKAVWVGTDDDGIYRIAGSHVDHYTTREGLSGNEADQFLEDAEGNLWVVTSKGLDRFRDLSVITYSMQQHLSRDNLESLLAHPDGSIWSMSYDTIDVLKGGRISPLDLKLPKSVKRVESALRDRDGRVWIGIDAGLYVIDGKRSLPVVRNDGKSLGPVLDMAQDTDGTVWVATLGRNDNLSRIDPHTLVGQAADVQFPKPARRIVPDAHAGVWAMITSGGVAHLVHRDGKDVIEYQIKPDGSVLGTFLGGNDGTLYLWSSAGLSLIRGDQTHFLAGKKADPCLQTYTSIFDRDGSMWVASACGLTRFTSSEIAGWWKESKLPYRPRLILDTGDGFSMGAKPFQPSSVISPDGRLWFATENGLLMLDPKHLVLNRIEPPVHISTLIADHQTLPLSTAVSVPARTRDVEIDYSGLSFSAPQKVLFRYMLEGRDKTWQDAGTRRQAFYSDLAPGRYTFRVIACNNSGLWNERGAVLTLTVLPAWYQTLWFRILSAGSVICLAWGFYLIRLRQLRREIDNRFAVQTAERMRIARELHDTLLQSLQGLLLSFSNFSAHVTSPPEIRQDMESSLDRAELLLISGRERIRELRSNALSNDLIGEINGLLDRFRSEDGPPLVATFSGRSRSLKPSAQDELLWILTEALTNACNHSGAKHIQVQLSQTRSSLHCVVQDDGRGMDGQIASTQDTGHFGVIGMRERARQIGGRLEITTAPGRGTSVSLSVPARLVYEKQGHWLRRLMS